MKTLDPLLKRREIVGQNVVLVRVGHFVCQPPPFVLLAQPQQILAQLNLGWQVSGIELQRGPLMLGPRREAIFFREFPADEVIDCRVGGPRHQRRSTEFDLFVRLGIQLRQHGPIGPRQRMKGVDLFDPLEQLFRLSVLLAINRVIDGKQQGVDVLGVEIECCFQ